MKHKVDLDEGETVTVQKCLWKIENSVSGHPAWLRCWTRLSEMLFHSWVLSSLPFNCMYASELVFILALCKGYFHRAISKVLTDWYQLPSTCSSSSVSAKLF